LIALHEPSAARQVEAGFKALVLRHQAEFNAGLEACLDEVERQTQRFVQGLGYAKGAWYRTPHNVIVTAVMVCIHARERCARDLVLAAQLHDVGYSVMELSSVAQGASWEGRRHEHMFRGADVAFGHLHTLVASLDLGLSGERIRKLTRIIATHDDPYGGKDLADPEARLVRSADRAFVPSALSYYKDMLAIGADTGYLEKLAKLGLELSPHSMLMCRLAFFYPSDDALPSGWDRGALPIRAELAAFNEGGRCEPCYTSTESEVVGEMFRARARELSALELVSSVEGFVSLVEDAFTHETREILSKARVC